MQWPELHKGSACVTPNMEDYAAYCAAFNWDSVRRELGVDQQSTLNIAELACDRHARGANASKVALRILDAELTATELTYQDLARQVSRFVNALAQLGVARGSVVATFTGRLPELYVTALGALKSGCSYCPLFSAFGPEPARARLELGQVSVLVTTEALYRRKIAPLRSRLPDLLHVLLVRTTGNQAALPPDTIDFRVLLDAQEDSAAVAPTRDDDNALLHFTSGTTGTPKGVVHVHGAVVAQYASARIALDIHADDIYWCTADPGWVTGTAYGIIGPLVCGVTSIVDSEDFDAQRWYSILEREAVTVWYTAPTAIRMLMKAGRELVSNRDLSSLRFLGSVGEPLNPEAVMWGAENLGLPFHDNWWQTETGAIMIANYACMGIRPGSMGKPLPGIEAAVVERHPDGTVTVIDAPERTGELALRPGWPSMFRAYLNAPERYTGCFANGWYLSGDMVRRDMDGYFWFIGRADDVIKSAGHLISPFEIESALMQHVAVAQAAAIGLPDPLTYQRVKAFVELRPGATQDDALIRSLLAHARRLLGPAVAPRDIAVVDSLPRTRSGKIMRRLLRARELGLPEGDLSTLESPS